MLKTLAYCIPLWMCEFIGSLGTKVAINFLRNKNFAANWKPYLPGKSRLVSSVGIHRMVDSLDRYLSACFQEVGEQIHRKWQVCKVAIAHRTGIVRIGQSSVIIAVSSAHRAEALEVSRIDPAIHNPRCGHVYGFWKKEWRFWLHYF